MKIIISHLSRAFNLTFDLVDAINADDLQLKLKDLPSNTIGEQIWCIVGARESYLKAIINQSWIERYTDNYKRARSVTTVKIVP